jgi:hypothetical protein
MKKMTSDEDYLRACYCIGYGKPSTKDSSTVAHLLEELLDKAMYGHKVLLTNKILGGTHRSFPTNRQFRSLKGFANSVTPLETFLHLGIEDDFALPLSKQISDYFILNNASIGVNFYF